jgi:hypothetical protein
MYNTYGAYLKSTGELDSMPDMGKWIDSKWLKEVAPDRVHFQKYHY